jgi:hypothetical protein
VQAAAGLSVGTEGKKMMRMHAIQSLSVAVLRRCKIGPDELEVIFVNVPMFPLPVGFLRPASRQSTCGGGVA